MGSFLDTVLRSLNSGGGTDEAASVTLSCGGAGFVLPIAPESYEVQVACKNETVNIINLGELNMIGETGLKTISLSSIFPAQAYDYCVITPEAPAAYISKIESWRTSKKPCRISIADTAVDFPCLIESFSYSEKDGSGDVFFTIDLKEYRYAAGAPTDQINKQTGLYKKPESFLSKVAKNIRVYPGDSITDVMGRAIGKSTTINNKQVGYLGAAKTILKSHGRLNTGDLIEVSKTSFKVGGKNVLL